MSLSWHLVKFVHHYIGLFFIRTTFRNLFRKLLSSLYVIKLHSSWINLQYIWSSWLFKERSIYMGLLQLYAFVWIFMKIGKKSQTNYTFRCIALYTKVKTANKLLLAYPKWGKVSLHSTMLFIFCFNKNFKTAINYHYSNGITVTVQSATVDLSLLF